MNRSISNLIAGGLLLLSAASQAVVTIDRVVAVVNRDIITRRELDDRIQSIKVSLEQQRVNLPSQDVLEQQVLDRMIMEMLISQAAKYDNISVSNTELDTAMNRLAEQNKLSLADFRKQIEAKGLKWERFREEVRSSILRSKVKEHEVDNRVLVSDSEVNDYLKAAGNKPEQEFNLAHVFVALPENATPDQVQQARNRMAKAQQEIAAGKSFAAVAAAYSNAPDATSGGELGWRPVGTLPANVVEKLQTLTPGQTTDLLRSNAGFHIIRLIDRRDQSGTLVVNQIHARHILVRINEVTTEADARQKITQIRDRILNGEKFDELARMLSDDSTANKGGDLGWLSPSDTVPEFEDAMLKLSPGQISPIIKTTFGLHLIQVLETRKQDVTQERKQIKVRMELRQRKADEMYQDWMTQLRSEATIQVHLKEE